MMNPDELEQGQFYFLLLFYLSKIEIPMIKTFIYVGKNLEDKGNKTRDEWFFQDPRSYLEHGSFLQMPKEIKRKVFVADEDALFQMYDINGLIERLKKIKEGTGSKPTSGGL
jgi:hypothetical protein